MDITVELPADPQRLVTASRVIYRRGRLASRTLGVFAIVLGAGLLATVLLADGDGFELLLGGARTAGPPGRRVAVHGVARSATAAGRRCRGRPASPRGSARRTAPGK